MKIEITDKQVIMTASLSIVLSNEREIQAFKNLLSLAESGLYLEARKPDQWKEEFEILTELQKIRIVK